jgi:trehalose/maltose hydrolase-like predicted phosphorylase
MTIVTGRYQDHVNADVAWAAAHYLDWTGDRRFARGGARALLSETARYWQARAVRDAAGRAHIRDVMGPDEYHAAVDDNAFTNNMAAWNLRRAAAVVTASDPGHRGEAAAWRRTARDLVDGYDPYLGRHVQFAGFDELEPLLISEIADPPVAADVLLGPGRTAATQVIKQADVLMLHHLLPGERPRGSLPRDVEHYLPRTAHGSSLSPGVHACLLARLGRHREAVDLLRLTARIDLDDLTQTTAGGLHLAAAGTVWQALVYGFLGVRPLTSGVLAIDPRLPGAWEGLTANLRFRGCALRVTARHEALHIDADRPVPIALSGRRHLLPARRSVFRPAVDGWKMDPR